MNSGRAGTRPSMYALACLVMMVAIGLVPSQPVRAEPPGPAATNPTRGPAIVPSLPSAVPTRAWSRTTARNLSLSDPGGLAYDWNSGFLFVADKGGNRIVAFYENGDDWTSEAHSLGDLSAPEGVWSAGDGIYVADTGNNRIRRFGNTWTTPDFGSHVFSSPRGIAIGGPWSVVPGPGPHRVNEYLNLLSEYSFLEPNPTFDPWGVSLGFYQTPPQPAFPIMYAVDHANNRVYKQGDHDRIWGSTGSGPGQLSAPTGLAAQGDHILVADTGNNRIQMFDDVPSDAFTFGTFGSGLGQFDHPRGVGITNNGGILVSDSGNNRIERWNMPASAPVDLKVERPADGALKFSWKSGRSLGGSNLVKHVIDLPGVGQMCEVPANQFEKTCTISGLTDGQPYDFTVRTVTEIGAGQPAAFPTSVPMPTGGRYQPTDPYRLLDTRNGTGSVATPVGPGETRVVHVGGTGGISGVPSTGVVAVAINLTAVNPSADTHITAFAAGSPLPSVSNLNLPAHDTRPNFAVVPVSASGDIALRNNSGEVHLVADIVGYFGLSNPSYPSENGLDFAAVTPVRKLDTRLSTPLGPGESRTLAVLDPLPPSTYTKRAVALNATAVGPSTATHVTVWSGLGSPTTSTLNVPAGATRPNLVVSQVTTQGTIVVFNNSGTTNVLIDLLGTFIENSASAARGDFHPIAPTRVGDSRSGVGPFAGAWGAETRTVPLTAAVPAYARAVQLNITVTGATAPSHLTVFPTGASLPVASTVNMGIGQTVANAAVVGLGTGQAIDIANNAGTTQVIVDVVGWYE